MKIGATGARKTPPPTSGAFTLIEMLVVISIVVLLVAMLLPALQSARDRGKAVVCLSNLQQLGVTLTTYANDYAGYIPAHYHNITYTGQFDFWDEFWFARLSQHGYIPGMIRPDGYSVLSDVVRCPSIPVRSEEDLIAEFGSGGSWVWQIQVYGMRAYSVSSVFDPDLNTGDIQKDKLLDQIPQPSGFFLLADSCVVPYGGIPGYQISYDANGLVWAINKPHADRTNVLMADGHADIQAASYFAGQYVYAPNMYGVYTVVP